MAPLRLNLKRNKPTTLIYDRVQDTLQTAEGLSSEDSLGGNFQWLQQMCGPLEHMWSEYSEPLGCHDCILVQIPHSQGCSCSSKCCTVWATGSQVRWVTLRPGLEVHCGQGKQTKYTHPFLSCPVAWAECSSERLWGRLHAVEESAGFSVLQAERQLWTGRNVTRWYSCASCEKDSCILYKTKWNNVHCGISRQGQETLNTSSCLPATGSLQQGIISKSLPLRGKSSTHPSLHVLLSVEILLFKGG